MESYQIIIRKRFENKVEKLLLYLKLNWSETVATNFYIILIKKMETLAKQPFLGKITSKYNVRSIGITKHNRLYYRVGNNKIEILNLFDTRINPKRNPFA